MGKINKNLIKIERRFYLTFKNQLVWMISTAFAIAAALAWKDAIALVIGRYISGTSELEYSIYSAVAITLVGIAVIWLANEIFKNK